MGPMNIDKLREKYVNKRVRKRGTGHRGKATDVTSGGCIHVEYDQAFVGNDGYDTYREDLHHEVLVILRPKEKQERIVWVEDFVFDTSKNSCTWVASTNPDRNDYVKAKLTRLK